MSLNKYMHPRNKYKNKKPSFLELALKYPEFRKQVTQDDSGKVFLDFKNADALRALTTCLLKEDFDLTVNLPSDRLVPTLPLRLNYLHWLEDIVGTESGKWGMDVGTGASCVYPLLAAKSQGWNFLATEADPENVYHAQKNVEANNLQELIHVKQVSVDDALLNPVETFKLVDTFDFCMCNPPFFADHMEAQAVTTSRSVDRPEAHTMSTASPQECIAKGGEVGFVRQMIEESVVLGKKIRVYSSMVGKKSSLTHLKEELRQQKVPKFSTTDFCQGKTMRWGIAWSFDESVNFPRSQFEGKKEKKPIQYVIPNGAGGVQYNVHSIAGFLKDIMASIKVHCYQGKIAKSYTSITLTAAENTWCHQRRRRRQQKRQEQEEVSSGDLVNDNKNNNDNETETETENSKSVENDKNSSGKAVHNEGDKSDDSKSAETDKNNASDQGTSTSGGKEIRSDAETCKANDLDVTVDRESNCRKRLLGDGIDFEHGEKPAKVIRLEQEKTDKKSVNQIAESKDNDKTRTTETNTEIEMTEEGKSDTEIVDGKVKDLSSHEVETDDVESSPTKNSDGSPKEYIVKCVMRLKRAGDVINLELEWLGGTSRELMYQIKTFLVNKLVEHESNA